MQDSFSVGVGLTSLNLFGGIFPRPGAFDLVTNEVAHKQIQLQATGNFATARDFTGRLAPGTGVIAAAAAFGVWPK